MIKVENVSLTYPKGRKTPEVLALSNCNVTFDDDSFNVIIGPSGSGKTTLLHAIAGLLKYEGKIYFDNKDASSIEVQDRDIAIVDQNIMLYPHLTVFENIAFPLKAKRMKREEIIDKVYRVAETLKLDYLLTRKPKELSVGQQQRVALAKALIKEPKIYLFDEPFSNASEDFRNEEREIIKQAVKKYCSLCIYVTHYLKEATSLADKMYVMHEGQIILSGTPREVVTSNDEKVLTLLKE